ncbi:MAG: ABC transporter permease [Chloroflexi bacterium]|nr:MAG: ABC transporter permease [Chloroflexota bacterium]TMB76428.1 MAG: ABC transporter permease [Chloroflexota bacterium]TMC30419.1 MAG: ABC transporter permease [Chloroflexota bacterium]TMC32323.1 MAG: ABC transporter permease [Chloroflexota bacterium]TMC59204.1 MAG: ABC transporter permease [Chloroflexota bacterium]
MRRYVVGRLLLMIPTLVGVAVLTFVVMRLVPGDIVALRYAGSSVPQDVIDRERALLGLDKPLWTQFVDWMTQLAHLDFGQSLWTGHAVIDEVWTRLPLSLELAVIATLFAVAFALPLGVIAAVKQDTWADYAIRIFSVGGLAMPSFWIGIMLVLGTITFFGWAPPLVFTPITEDPIANLSQLILPAVSVGYRYSAVSMRMTRSTLLEVLREDYVRTARAKGLRETLVVVRHALRNALLPVVTVISLEFAFLIGGLVVTEQVFNLNGIGKLLVDAVTHRDYPLIQALVLLLASVFVIVNFIVDLIYVFLDPRIRYS